MQKHKKICGEKYRYYKNSPTKGLFSNYIKDVLKRFSTFDVNKTKTVLSFYDEPKEKYELFNKILNRKNIYFTLCQYDNDNSYMLRNF